MCPLGMYNSSKSHSSLSAKKPTFDFEVVWGIAHRNFFKLAGIQDRRKISVKRLNFGHIVQFILEFLALKYSRMTKMERILSISPFALAFHSAIKDS